LNCVFGAKFDAGTVYPGPKCASLRAKADSYCSGKVLFPLISKELRAFDLIPLNRA